jgi:hypothetical protein
MSDERDIETDAYPAAHRQPSSCGQPERPCQYEQDRAQLAASTRRVERRLDDIARTLGEVQQSLARGGVRIEAFATLPDRVSAIETSQQTTITRLGIVERIVYGVCSVIGLAVVGAILALIIRSP